MTTINASAPTATASLAAAVTGAVKTDVTRALTSAGLGAFASSQGGSDTVVRFSSDAVSALQSPSSQGALASLSKVLTSDVGSALNQFGMGAAAGSGQVADFVKTLSSDVLSAAQAAGYNETAVAAPATPAPAPTGAAASPSAQPTSAQQAAPAPASPAATAATGTAAKASSTDDTIASIMKALSPLMGNGAQFAAVTVKIADSLGQPRADGQTGMILSKVADNLRSADALAAAAPSTAGAAPTSGTAKAVPPANSTPPGAASPAGPAPSGTTGAQAAINALAAIVAQNRAASSGAASSGPGKPALANLGASVTKSVASSLYAAA